MHTGNMVGRWWFLVEESLLLLLLIPFPTFFVSHRSPLCVNFFYFFLLPVGDLTDHKPANKNNSSQMFLNLSLNRQCHSYFRCGFNRPLHCGKRRRRMSIKLSIGITFDELLQSFFFSSLKYVFCMEKEQEKQYR